jgi:hypothetical protein
METTLNVRIAVPAPVNVLYTPGFSAFQQKNGVKPAG